MRRLRPLAICLLAAALADSPGEALAADPRGDETAPTLAQLCAGGVPIVDLAHTLSAEDPYWPGDDYQPLELKTIATLERDGVLSKTFSMPEHMGTHLDAPNHFARGQASVDEIKPEDLFSVGVMIDITAAAAGDADYRLSLADVRRWEAEHGPIPERAVVLLRTGWARFWNQPARYRNQDAQGQMHFPGYSLEAAEYLIDQRKARGLGIDTLSIDYGLSRDFEVHRLANGRGRYGLENLAALDRLPPRGFYLVVAPIKLKTGSGGPARVFALLGGEDEKAD